MEIYDINGQIIDPLAGKTLYVAGDSIAYGKGSAGGYGKCIADRYGMQLINEAVDGATLATLVPDNVNGGYRTSIGMTVKSSTELEKADYILLEGGVNDAWNNAKLGTLNGSFDPAFYMGDTIGTLEAMLDYLTKKRSDKRVAYVFPHGGLFASSENWYKTTSPRSLRRLKSGACPMWILRNAPPPMGAHGVSELSDKYTIDGTHPNQGRLRAILHGAHRCAAEAAVRGDTMALQAYSLARDGEAYLSPHFRCRSSAVKTAATRFSLTQRWWNFWSSCGRILARR